MPALLLEIIEKAWGITRCVHKSAACEVWHASIRAGGESSLHYHVHKANDFYVLTGSLEIQLEALGDKFTTIATAGECFSIPPLTLHRFHATTHVELIETYWLPPIDPEDIERHG